VPKPALLVLTSTFPRWAGDSEPAFVLHLCRELTAGFDVHVIAPHTSGAMPREELDGVNVHRFRYLPERWQTLAYAGGIPNRLRENPLCLLQVPFFLAGQLLLSLCLARRLRVKVIHAHWILPQGLLALFVRWLTPHRPAVLCTAHGADLFALRSPMSRWLLRQVMQRVQGVTVVSRSMVAPALALGVAAEHLGVASMGVDVDGIFTPATGDREPGTILFAGRLVPKKGVRHLVAAMAGIVRELPGTRLAIIGDGPERKRLEQQVRDLDLGGHVTFAGAMAQPDLAARFRRSAVAAFPFVAAADGDAEGLGLVVVEAQACGCPVVTSDIPAVGDTVEPDVTGLVVPPGDPIALAGALIRLLTDAPLAGKLARAGMTSARERFAWPVAGARYRAILDALVSRG